MTDPTTPNHDQPVEGARSTSPDGAETSTGAGASGGSSAKATDVLDQIREVVEDFAEKAAPTVREFSAKAAEVIAAAADRAVPLAQKAGEATADASGKLAVKSRAWASDLREALAGDDTPPPATTDTPAPGGDDHGPGPTA